MKWLMFIYVFGLPFVMVANLPPDTTMASGWPVAFVVAIAALGFYGLDEVAEVRAEPSILPASLKCGSLQRM